MRALRGAVPGWRDRPGRRLDGHLPYEFRATGREWAVLESYDIWAASGEVYEGQWIGGTYDGRGTYLYTSGDVYEGEYKQGRRDGRGVYMYAAGDIYEGEYRQGHMEGCGTYRLADGSAEVGRYKSGADVGEGARWSPDRAHAWRLRNGKVVEEVSLDEAARIAHALGLTVPAPILGGDDDEGDAASQFAQLAL